MTPPKISENGIIDALGGPAVLSNILGCSVGSVYTWRSRRSIPWAYGWAVNKLAFECGVEWVGWVEYNKNLKGQQ